MPKNMSDFKAKPAKKARVSAAGWLPPKGAIYTGFCSNACDTEYQLGLELGSTDRHKPCRGAFIGMQPGDHRITRCACACHSGEEEPTDVAQVIDRARAERARAAGKSLTAIVTNDRGVQVSIKKACKHGHDLTLENAVDKRGLCRECRREATRRCLARKAEREGGPIAE